MTYLSVVPRKTALSVLQAVLLPVVSYVLWSIFRPFVVKSSLSNIPGPPAESWWKGVCLLSSKYGLVY